MSREIGNRAIQLLPMGPTNSHKTYTTPNERVPLSAIMSVRVYVCVTFIGFKLFSI